MTKGKPIVLSAPSGTGKTTLAKMLAKSQAHTDISISYTTRPPRGQEQDGREYHFVSDTKFDELIKMGEFLEWAHVHGYRYGSGKRETVQLLNAGNNVVFDIDVQGGLQIKNQIPETKLIFIMPPSFEVLKKRLVGRGTENADKVALRMAASKREIAVGLESYDYVIMNDNLKRASLELIEIISEKALEKVDRALLHKEFL